MGKVSINFRVDRGLDWPTSPLSIPTSEQRRRSSKVLNLWKASRMRDDNPIYNNFLLILPPCLSFVKYIFEKSTCSWILFYVYFDSRFLLAMSLFLLLSALNVDSRHKGKTTAIIVWGEKKKGGRKSFSALLVLFLSCSLLSRFSQKLRQKEV